MDSPVANQLNSQSLDNVLSSVFKQVGGRVFPDSSSTPSLTDLVSIVDAFRATHLLSYGNAIPNTGVGVKVTLSGDASNDIIVTPDNQCLQVNAISVLNGGGAPAACDIFLGETLIARIDLPPSTHVVPPLYLPLTLSNGQTLTAIKVSGTASDITVNVSTVNTCL